jgi:hypothetical protein
VQPTASETAFSFAALGDLLSPGGRGPAAEVAASPASGDPFYALEIARFLLQEAKPSSPGDPLPVPPTMEELLRARITRLPTAARDALQAAALLSEPTLEALRASART